MTFCCFYVLISPSNYRPGLIYLFLSSRGGRLQPPVRVRARSPSRPSPRLALPPPAAMQGEAKPEQLGCCVLPWPGSRGGPVWVALNSGSPSAAIRGAAAPAGSGAATAASLPCPGSGSGWGQLGVLPCAPTLTGFWGLCPSPDDPGGIPDGIGRGVTQPCPHSRTIEGGGGREIVFACPVPRWGKLPEHPVLLS